MNPKKLAALGAVVGSCPGIEATKCSVQITS